MKTKKNKKKLVLNKISIAQLDKDILNKAKGGVEESIDPCEAPPTVYQPQCIISIIITINISTWRC